MDWNQITAGGLVLAVAAALWRQVQTLLCRIAGLLVVTSRVNDYAACSALIGWLERNGRMTRWAACNYFSARQYVRSQEKRMSVLYQSIGTESTLYWVGWTPVLVRFGRQAVTGSPTETDFRTDSEVCYVTRLRGTLDLPGVLAGALADQQTNTTPSSGRYRVRRVSGSRRNQAAVGYGAAPHAALDIHPHISPSFNVVGYAPNDIGEPNPVDPWLGKLRLPAADRVRAVVGRWLNEKKWYESRGVAWRTGVLLYGPPGTGKTTVVRAVAQEFGLPVFSFDLSTLTNDEFVAGWDEAQTDAPAVVLLEDVDAVFDGRNNVAWPDGGLTFDCLLNCLSGVQSANGTAVMITTNRPDRLDPALGRFDPDTGMSTRPGRIDLAVEVGPPDDAGRRRLADTILDDPDDVDRVVEASAGWSVAQVHARCVEVALDRRAAAWNGS